MPRDSLFGPRPLRQAVRRVDLEVQAGEGVALIGESGSGKSTLVRVLLALDARSAGTVHFDGREVRPGSARSLHWLRRQTGIVLQDPYSSLDPRMTAAQIVAEPLRALHISGNHAGRVAEVLSQVGLGRSALGRYPHEFSGGQRQRVALARALVHRPRLLIGDEPLSALDVTVRAQILGLLRQLRQELGFSILLVSHDIGLVHHLCDQVNVMKGGEVVERGPTAQVFAAPQHPYTRRLLASVPSI